MKRKIISLAAAAVMLFACFAAPAGGEALPAGSEQIGIPVFTEETMEKAFGEPERNSSTAFFRLTSFPEKRNAHFLDRK